MENEGKKINDAELKIKEKNYQSQGSWQRIKDKRKRKKGVGLRMNKEMEGDERH